MTDCASGAATQSVTAMTEPSEERVPLGRVLVFAAPLIGVFLANSLMGVSGFALDQAAHRALRVRLR